jgi:hypothetical protein
MDALYDIATNTPITCPEDFRSFGKKLANPGYMESTINILQMKLKNMKKSNVKTLIKMLAGDEVLLHFNMENEGASKELLKDEKIKYLLRTVIPDVSWKEFCRTWKNLASTAKKRKEDKQKRLKSD